MLRCNIVLQQLNCQLLIYVGVGIILMITISINLTLSNIILIFVLLLSFNEVVPIKFIYIISFYCCWQIHSVLLLSLVSLDVLENMHQKYLKDMHVILTVKFFHVQLDDGLELSFTDKRRFAKVRLLNDVLQYHFSIWTNKYFHYYSGRYLIDSSCNYFFGAANFCTTYIWTWSWCIAGAHDGWWIYWFIKQKENYT